MLACSVEELEVDKCRRAGWRSGTSFRGASSFSAEKLVSKHHTSALGHKLSLPLSRPDLLSQLSRSSLARAWWRASAETATRRCHVPDSSRARKGRRKAQAWMERNNSNKPPTFLGDNDVRRKASPTTNYHTYRLSPTFERARDDSDVADIDIMILIPVILVGMFFAE